MGHLLLPLVFLLLVTVRADHISYGLRPRMSAASMGIRGEIRSNQKERKFRMLISVSDQSIRLDISNSDFVLLTLHPVVESAQSKLPPH